MRKSQRHSIAIVLVASVATILAGCSSSTKSGTSTYKIGELYSGSGALSSLGIPTDQGISLAIDEVNAAGGVNGKKIELIKADYQSKSELAVPKFRELTGQGVLAVAGPESTTISTSIAPLAGAAKVLVLAASGSNPKSPWAFSSFPATGYFSLQADYVKSVGKLPVCATVIPGAAQQVYDTAVFPVYAKEGAPIVDEIEHDAAATDLTPQMTAARAKGCKSIYVTAAGTQIIAAAQAMVSLGMTSDVIISNGANANSGVLDALGATSKLVHFALPKVVLANQLPDTDPVKAKVINFYNAFTAKYHQTPQPNTVVGYIIGQTIVDGLKAGATTAVKLRDWLETSTEQSIVGPYVRTADNHNGAQSEGYFVMGTWDPTNKSFVIDAK